MNLPTAVSPTLFFSIAVLCVLLLGISKAGFGGGVGILATPLLSLVASPAVAAGILLPILCASDVVASFHYRTTLDRPSMRLVLLPTVLGIAAGSLFLWYFRYARGTERALQVMIGLIALGYLGYLVVRRRLLAHLPPRQGGRLIAWSMGLLTGFSSTLAHAGGATGTIYFLSRRLEPRLFAGSLAWLMTIGNFIKLTPYACLGMLDFSNLRVSLMLLPVVPIGTGLGVWLNRRVSAVVFLRIIHITLFLAAIQLLSGHTVVDLFR